MKRAFYSGLVALVIAAVVAACAMQMTDTTGGGALVRIDSDDIGGVVTGPKGPEGGVWVIAETRDLPTRYAKMVVTFSVWCRVGPKQPLDLAR